MILPIKSNHLAYAISILAFRDLTTEQLSNSSLHTTGYSSNAVGPADARGGGRSLSIGSSSALGQSLLSAPGVLADGLYAKIATCVTGQDLGSLSAFRLLTVSRTLPGPRLTACITVFAWRHAVE